MNMVEIFFGIITRQAIRRGTFTSVKQLISAIENFIDGWNTRCTPFIWTKTADDILTKAHRKTTSNTRHWVRGSVTSSCRCVTLRVARAVGKTVSMESMTAQDQLFATEPAAPRPSSSPGEGAVDKTFRVYDQDQSFLDKGPNGHHRSMMGTRRRRGRPQATSRPRQR